ncbi:hypothetical protein GCM10007989_03750 [Devosia pacifica]|uniref:DUF3572 domain-containing protein n=1 Tax=Devosia pacifica TaxID=1335967 RepID=A0A918VPD4_9HYPH|nr:DUF3572 family protein [Devosia pacifica]GHA12536.1 hypothetical protein GCM10007989_03750 [Devosia pacifica]
MNDSTRSNVDALAAQCLGYLAEHPDELAEFMVQTGYSPDQLRSAVGSQDLNAGLLDYFAGREAILLAFCANSGVSPETFTRVWQQQNPHD